MAKLAKELAEESPDDDDVSKCVFENLNEDERLAMFLIIKAYLNSK